MLIFASVTEALARSAVAIVPSAILAEETDPSARSVVAMVPSRIFAEVIALLATVGLG